MLQQAMDENSKLVDRDLDRLLPDPSCPPQSIHQAMRHSVFAGGKRLRPNLCLEAARAVAGRLPDGINDLACALEMLHTYSLIHDDLPALDNDELRRGKPTCHVIFGEAIAILAGDALQTLAYSTLARLRCEEKALIAIVAEVAASTGTVNGMIGGQVMDIEAAGSGFDGPSVEAIHRSKTGALIAASLATGGLYSGGSEEEVTGLRNFGRSVGVAFQIIDDVLDVTQSSQQLGKTAGKDVATQKATYPAVFGIDDSIRQANSFVTEACDSLDCFGPRAGTLKELALFLIRRTR